MLATFVIGLREGLEAALIVGIIAAFLKQQGAAGALRRMWLGVGLAVLLCLGIGIALSLLSGSLPQRQQEMLETIIGLVAVAMVTWMVLWMRSHSKDLKKDLGRAVGGALASGSAVALVAMAFLAVVREGVETAVFLVAASQTAAGASTFAGAGLGIAVAAVLGYLIYRGGMRLNLSRFFRITGVVLVLVAGGVLMSSLYHAHEADWIVIGGQTWLDFSGFIRPGSVPEALLSGVFGVRAQLRAIDVLAWLLYVIPMLIVVLWPAKRLLARRTVARLLVAVGVAGLLVAGISVAWANAARPEKLPATETFRLALPAGQTAASGSGDVLVSARLQESTADRIIVDLSGSLPGTDPDTAARFDEIVTTGLSGADEVAGRSGVTYTGPKFSVATGGETTMTAAELAELNGGRFPVGLRAADGDIPLTVTETTSVTPIVVLDRAAGTVLSVRLQLAPAVVATGDNGRTHRVALEESELAPTAAMADRVADVAEDRAADLQRASTLGELVPWLLGVWGGLLMVCGLVLFLRRSRGPTPDRVAPDEIPTAAEPARQH